MTCNKLILLLRPLLLLLLIHLHLKNKFNNFSVKLNLRYLVGLRKTLLIIFFRYI